MKRVLRDDGVAFVNLSDSYAGSGKGPTGHNGIGDAGERQGFTDLNIGRGRTWDGGVRAKSLYLVPERLVIALQEPWVVPTCVKKESDRAWLAAFMDGEGTIGIRQERGRKGLGGQTWQDGFVAYACAANNDIELLEHCVAITGRGSVRLKSKAGVDGRGITSRRDSYGWRLDANPAVDVIRAVYPYLIAKRKQAILAYTLDVLNKQARDARERGVLTRELWERREYLKTLIGRCNQREPVDMPDWVLEPKQEVEPGWIVRSKIAWCKASTMPESVQDRPTRAWEYIFMLTKSPKYWYDADAVRQPIDTDYLSRRWGGTLERGWPDEMRDLGTSASGATGRSAQAGVNPAGANIRDFWILPPSPSDYDFCGACDTLYQGSQRRSIRKRVCPTCGATDGWVAHFAAYPSEIPRRAILAACPERCCSVCGAGWRRVTKKTPLPNASRLLGRGADLADSIRPGWLNGQYDRHGDFLEGYSRETIGWEPVCDHDAGTVPGVALDCFLGSGTTLLAANRLGRRGIGIELNASYAALSRARLESDAPLLEMVPAGDEWQQIGLPLAEDA